MAGRIDTVEGRAKLKPRHEPYWHRLTAGCYLGVRKIAPASAGSWVAKHRDAHTGERMKRSLGEFEQLPAAQRFDAAKAEAEAWFKHLGTGGAAGVTTMKDVCARYVAHVRAEKGETAAKDAARRFENYVLDDAKLAALDVTKLAPVHLDNWRKALRARPTESGGNRGAQRTASTLNRDMTCLRAALNLAYLDGLVTSDFAWRAKLRPLKDADRRRAGYLDKGQRRKLIDNAPADLASFLRGLSLLPLRPGALAALTAGQFDKRKNELRLGHDKSGAERKLVLPKDTAAFFAAQAKDKLPSAPLLARADGKAWDKDAWKWPVKAAVEAAKLPAGTTAYTLRHSTITDLVVGKLDLLTVAQISGTSVRMIERHYGHLQSERATQALAKLAL